MILDVAVELFDSVGYRNASLADLITATGVSKGAFYYHFTNRESVAAAIIEEADAMLQTTSREILADPSGGALGNLIRTVFEIAALSGRVSLVAGRDSAAGRPGSDQHRHGGLAAHAPRLGGATTVPPPRLHSGVGPAATPASPASVR